MRTTSPVADGLSPSFREPPSGGSLLFGCVSRRGGYPFEVRLDPVDTGVTRPIATLLLLQYSPDQRDVP